MTENADSIPEDGGIPAMAELGKKMVVLGTAMQNPDTNVRELVRLASDCGLRVDIHAVRTTPRADVPVATPPRTERMTFDEIMTQLDTMEAAELDSEQKRWRYQFLHAVQRMINSVPKVFHNVLHDIVMQEVEAGSAVVTDDNMEDMYSLMLTNIKDSVDKLNAAIVAFHDGQVKPA